ncbi:hypothetical protein [Blautia obeum]|uniref:hypothetical protein n=1 Tax=Blautia obeum TaxID=40520 RepID=UPI001FA87054|nr:hypothetical protein [Blautia obeum]
MRRVQGKRLQLDSQKRRKKTVKAKKPSIHERLEINKGKIQEKQGKDKPERGADLGLRTV